MNDRPDLDKLVAYWQGELRVVDWRVRSAYVRDLVNPDGKPVHGLCSRLVDNKTATIQIRDPETPATANDPPVEEIVIHELAHLLAAPLSGGSPADIAAEENMVWAFSEALIKAKGSAQQGPVMRAMVARITGRNAAAPEDRSNHVNDPKSISAAIAAIKSSDGDAALAILEKMLVDAAGGEAAPEPDGDEGSPPGEAAPPPPAGGDSGGPPPPAGDDGKKKPEGPPAAAKPPMSAAPAPSMPKPATRKAAVMPTDPAVAELAAQVQKLTDKQAASDAVAETTERAQLVAERPALAAGLRAMIVDVATPIATARQIAAAIAPTVRAAKALSTEVVAGTQAAGTGNGAARTAQLAPAERAELDARMGRGSSQGAIRREGNSVVFRAMTPEDAQAHLSKNGKVA